MVMSAKGPNQDLLGQKRNRASSAAVREGSLQRRDVQQSTKPSVSAGGKVTRGKTGLGVGGNGTASLIVRMHGQSTGAYVVTCAHVLGPASITANPDADAVYSPELQTTFGIECNSPIGQVVPATLQPATPYLSLPAQQTIGQENFGMDAALISLVSDANAANVVPKIGQISGVRDLVQEWNLSATSQSSLTLTAAQQIKVRKYGAITHYTEGVVSDLARQAVVNVTGPGALVLEINVTTAPEPFSEPYDIDISRFISDPVSDVQTIPQLIAKFAGTSMTVTQVGSDSSNSVLITGQTFSQQGDSGAPVVDERMFEKSWQIKTHGTRTRVRPSCLEAGMGKHIR